MTTEIKARTFQRVATAADWTSVNPILGNGEIGVDVTNNQFRVGDGIKRWLQLPPVGVTVGQIEALINQYLEANPPASGGGGGGGASVSTQDIAPGVIRVTITTTAGGGDAGGGEGGPAVAPSVTSSPAVSTYAAGGSRVTFTATASGSPLNFQWYRSTNMADWTPISGATSASYQTPALAASDNESFYRCVVSNSAGTATSAAARLRVSPAGAPVITAHPISPDPTPTNSSANLGVSATGASAFAWQLSYRGPDAPDAEWSDYANQNNSTLSIPVGPLTPQGDLFYRAKVSNASGSTYSNAARLQVSDAGNILPRILPGLPRYIVAPAGSSRTLTFTATGSGTLSYRWRAGSGNAYLPETSASLTLANLSPSSSGITYTGEAVGYQGAFATSGDCTIIVPNPAGPTIVAQPDDIATFVGGQAPVAVAAAGGAITYQWQSSADGAAGWANIAGATAATYAGATQTTYLRCILTNGAGSISTRAVLVSFEGD